MGDKVEETRRSIAVQKKEFLRQFDRAVRDENEGAFRLLLKAWEIEEGSTAWTLAWDAWREEMAAKKRPRRRLRP